LLTGIIAWWVNVKLTFASIENGLIWKSKEKIQQEIQG
jgi:hypothetical protein